MASYNKVMLLGNIVRTPELRHARSGDLAIVSTAIAVNRKTTRDKEETMFIDIVIFGEQAEVFNSYVQKGTSVMVEGRLSQNTWEQEGKKRSKHEVIVENFQLLGGKRDNQPKQDDDQAPVFPPSDEVCPKCGLAVCDCPTW